MWKPRTQTFWRRTPRPDACGSGLYSLARALWLIFSQFLCLGLLSLPSGVACLTAIKSESESLSEAYLLPWCWPLSGWWGRLSGWQRTTTSSETAPATTSNPAHCRWCSRLRRWKEFVAFLTSCSGASSCRRGVNVCAARVCRVGARLMKLLTLSRTAWLIMSMMKHRHCWLLRHWGPDSVCHPLCDTTWYAAQAGALWTLYRSDSRWHYRQAFAPGNPMIRILPRSNGKRRKRSALWKEARSTARLSSAAWCSISMTTSRRRSACWDRCTASTTWSTSTRFVFAASKTAVHWWNILPKAAAALSSTSLEMADTWWRPSQQTRSMSCLVCCPTTNHISRSVPNHCCPGFVVYTLCDCRPNRASSAWWSCWTFSPWMTALRRP